jgi:sec-independent protein translocase protein TatB
VFDLGWTELLVIGIVSLIVVGPKDLPVLFRKAGQFIGKAKGMAREFSRAMDQAADETGVRDVTKTLNTVTNPIKSSLDGVTEATKSFKNWNPEFESGGLSEDRAEAAEKIHSATAKKAGTRQAAEAAAASAGGAHAENPETAAGTAAKTQQDDDTKFAKTSDGTSTPSSVADAATAAHPASPNAEEKI